MPVLDRPLRYENSLVCCSNCKGDRGFRGSGDYDLLLRGG
jgi:hypothetical protein